MADTLLSDELAAAGLVASQLVRTDDLNSRLQEYTKTVDLPTGGGGGGGSAPTFLRYASVGRSLPDSAANTGTPIEIMARATDFARYDLKRPRPVFGIGWYVNNAGAEVALPGTFEITASIEYPISTFRQLKFGGQVKGSYQGGDIAIPDELTADLAIPAGEPFAVKFWLKSPGGYVYDNSYSAMAGDTFNIGQGSTTPDLTMTTQSGGSSQSGVGLTHLGVIDNIAQEADLDIGDHNCAGDDKEERDINGAFGVLARMTRGKFGGINAGRSGTTATQFTAANRPRTIALAQYAGRLKCILGVLDCRNGMTAAAVATELVRIRNLFPDRKFYIATLPPLQDGSGTSFLAQDGSDQVANVNNGQVSALNVLIRGGLVTNSRPAINGVLDLRTVLEHPSDPTKWRTYGTIDGLNMKPAMFKIGAATCPGRELLF
ncbi:hypothetical protein [Sphingobium sp.]|uniref:hypothetical protein n=1 Tax=Sphingobium sp. TaxID=1912891 RepID=UPI003BB7FCD9